MRWSEGVAEPAIPVTCSRLSKTGKLTGRVAMAVLTAPFGLRLEKRRGLCDLEQKCMGASPVTDPHRSG
ncbi:MAG: hypothetical protein KBA44_06685 [Methanoculleus sp.]|nr:hypothetical protein [Methanoculleus sp.]